MTCPDGPATLACDMPAPITTIPLHEAWAFCHDVLPHVSRTFALNIPVLPGGLRDGVCVAYLLCRIADTIEDCETLSDAERLDLYGALRRAVDGDPAADGRELAGEWAEACVPGYARLVRNAPLVLAAFHSVPPDDRAAIRDCVHEMIDGMRRLAARGATDNGVRFITDSLAQLDEYCHYVAGTVGVMLARLFDRAIGGESALASTVNLERGRRFGLGLQATNIIKDHAEDVARGVCFVPRDCCDVSSGAPRLSAAGRSRLIGHAMAHLDEAMRFVLAAPSTAEGIRLFCLWALFLALGTLREAARGGGAPPKVGRAEVATILDRGRALVGDDEALRSWFATSRSEVLAALRTMGRKA